MLPLRGSEPGSASPQPAAHQRRTGDRGLWHHGAGHGTPVLGDAQSRNPTRPMTYVEYIRLLSCEFEIRTNSPEMMDRLSLIMPRAEQDVPVVERCTVTVDWTGDEFRIDIDGVDEDFELSVRSALETLYQHLQRRA